MSVMKYKDYVGSVEFSEEDGIFFGKVLGIRSLLSYEGANASELVEDFHGVVDDYLALCKEEGTEPEKAYKGSFNIRITPELHRTLALQAIAENLSLNSFVEKTLVRAMAN